jgi:hypothetical protein
MRSATATAANAIAANNAAIRRATAVLRSGRKTTVRDSRQQDGKEHLQAW